MSNVGSSWIKEREREDERRRPSAELRIYVCIICPFISEKRFLSGLFDTQFNSIQIRKIDSTAQYTCWGLLIAFSFVNVSLPLIAFTNLPHHPIHQLLTHTNPSSQAHSFFPLSPPFTANPTPHFSPSANLKLTLLTQCRSSVGVGYPSPLNTWPRCPPHLLHVISVRDMPSVESVWRVTAPGMESK